MECFHAPAEAPIIGLADELMIFVVTKQLKDRKLYEGEAIHCIKTCLWRVNLDVSDEKWILPSGSNAVNVRVGGHKVVWKSTIKYLEMMIKKQAEF